MIREKESAAEDKTDTSEGGAEDRKPSSKQLPKTGKNNAAIIAAIENKLGPVGKGHHNSHRTAALEKWLREKEKRKKS